MEKALFYGKSQKANSAFYLSILGYYTGKHTRYAGSNPASPTKGILHRWAYKEKLLSGRAIV